MYNLPFGLKTDLWLYQYNLTGSLSSLRTPPDPTISSKFKPGPGSSSNPFHGTGGVDVKSLDILLHLHPSTRGTAPSSFSQPGPGMPGKVNSSGPSGNPRGQAWLLTLNSLWSGCLLSRNRRHLGKLKTHSEKGTHSQTLIHLGKSSQRVHTQLYSRNLFFHFISLHSIEWIFFNRYSIMRLDTRLFAH